MRIISQTGDDIPYERCVFTIFGEFVYAAPIYNLENKFVVASYSTQDKAEKAMQKLRECYLGIHVVEKLNDTVDCSSLSQIGIYKKNEKDVKQWQQETFYISANYRSLRTFWNIKAT